MEFRDLHAFVTCIDLGSMTRAAEHNHVVQSTVSQAVARLESDCGLRLLHRRRGGVRPTEAGEALAAHARGLITAMDRAREDMLAFAGLQKGTIRLGILHTATPLILTKLLRSLRAEHPGLRLHVEEGTSSEVAQGLVTGELDVGVLFLPVAPGPFRVVTLAPVELVVIASPGELGLDQPPVSLADLRDQPWVVFPSDNPGRQWLDTACAEAGFAPLVAAEVGTLAQLKYFASAGIGLAMVPAAAVEPERAAGFLRCAALSRPTTVNLGYAYRSPQPGLAPSAFRRLLEHHFGTVP